MTFKEDTFYIKQVLEGDNSAFAMLVERHKDMVFTIVIKLVKNHHEAEEVAQDVFIKAYQALPGFEGTARFSTWLYRIAYNTAISKWRKPKKVFAPIDENLIDNFTTDSVERGVEALSQEEMLLALNSVMEKLPEEDSLLLNLFYKNSMTVEDISQITGLTQSNVKVRLYRIRKRMYDELKNQLNL
ncbi:MAG TPA: sigma-70 family RNA polymerase sigma factor [Bacteroidales bacterium]|nr:sigma-70 family RNA polymerase sigma factor [Bacteroidales bacterium]